MSVTSKRAALKHLEISPPSSELRDDTQGRLKLLDRYLGRVIVVRKRPFNFNVKNPDYFNKLVLRGDLSGAAEFLGLMVRSGDKHRVTIQHLYTILDEAGFDPERQDEWESLALKVIDQISIAAFCRENVTNCALVRAIEFGLGRVSKTLEPFYPQHYPQLSEQLAKAREVQLKQENESPSLHTLIKTKQTEKALELIRGITDNNIFWPEFDERDEQGDTPLHTAILHDEEVAKALIPFLYSHQLKAINHCGERPVDLADRINQDELAVLIEERIKTLLS